MKNLVAVVFVSIFSFNGQAHANLSHSETVSLDKPRTTTRQISSSIGDTQEYLIRNAMMRGSAMGGGDAGGGNLFQGRPLESYALKVTQSPEMQMAVKLLSSIGRIGFDSLASEIQYVVQRKSWFVVPVNLPVLSGQSIGISFAADQGALQDFEEIWIDQKTYDKMNFEGRVQLLVHEIFMGLKILSFESYYRQCEINKPFNVDCLALHEHQDRKTLRIEAKDYKDVRKAVSTIFENYEYLSTTTYSGPEANAIAAQIFNGEGFDSYFVMPSNRADRVKEFGNKDIVNALRNQITKSGLPQYCNHTIVQDMGNHTYRMRAQLKSDIAFESRDNTDLKFKVTAKDVRSGKTVVSNTYALNTKSSGSDANSADKKSALTLSYTMGVPAYTMQYFAGVGSSSSKTATQIGMIAVGITSDESVKTLAFGTFNVRNGKFSFYDGKDKIKCLEKFEYTCVGPECLN